MQRIIRFFQIDLQYFFLPLPFFTKLRNLFSTNISLFSNLILGRKNDFPTASLSDRRIVYDTPFSTKTFLAAIYDFYNETQRDTLLPENAVVVDIGSNIGQYLTAIKAFKPKAKVYCFEPDPTIFAILKKNAAQYSDVTIFNHAVSDRVGTEKFYVSLLFSEWSSFEKSAISGDVKEVKVSSVVGDKILEKVGEIDLLKIDVEGAELKVVSGLLKTLKRTKYLMIETSILRNSSDLGSSMLLQLLFEQGFYIHSIGRIFSEGIGKHQGAADILFKNKKY